LESGHRYKENLFVSHVDVEFDQLNVNVPWIILQEHVDDMPISQNSPLNPLGPDPKIKDLDISAHSARKRRTMETI
jgi:hypothetical protein